VAHRSALAYSRSEEASADQAGLRYLAAAGGDPQAMLEVLDHFRGQDALLSGGNVDAYALSHPMWSERMALIEDRVAKLPKGTAPAAEDAYWHRRMVAKLDAFLGSPAQTLRKYPEGDGSEAAALARAIAWHRRPEPGRAGAAMRELLAARPDDPWYLELEGQFLLESGRAAAAADAYRRAAALAPKEPLVLGGLGRALLNMDEDRATAEARDVLARAAAADRANPAVLRDLALAEARLGNEGAAALATAERFAVEGAFADALRNATRAAALLPEGAPGWRRAQDIITMSRRALK
jgi:predicted Zn-dependent protease